MLDVIPSACPEEMLFGSYRSMAACQGVDIGGKDVRPNFSSGAALADSVEMETPPIPVHVHNGYRVHRRWRKGMRSRKLRRTISSFA